MSDKDNIFNGLQKGKKIFKGTAVPERDKIRSVFKKEEGNLIDIFEKKLTNVNGIFHFSKDMFALQKEIKSFFKSKNEVPFHVYEDNIQDLLLKAGIPFTSTPDDMAKVAISMTGCEYLIARLGTILVSSENTKSRKIIAFPPVHAVIAPTSKLIYDLPDALDLLEKRFSEEPLPSMISLITGPSRTADIEKTLILGAHGPKELHVFLYND